MAYEDWVLALYLSAPFCDFLFPYPLWWPTLSMFKLYSPKPYCVMLLCFNVVPAINVHSPHVFVFVDILWATTGVDTSHGKQISAQHLLSKPRQAHVYSLSEDKTSISITPNSYKYRSESNKEDDLRSTRAACSSIVVVNSLTRSTLSLFVSSKLLSLDSYLEVWIFFSFCIAQPYSCAISLADINSADAPLSVSCIFRESGFAWLRR